MVDKPAGLPSQGTRDRKGPHVYGLLSEGGAYVGLHHRLDTAASGLLLLVRDPRQNAAVSRLFQEGRIERTYLAVVVGDPGERGTWNERIDGLTALTHWERVHYDGGVATLRVRLETGRTHQIRRHAAEAQHPLLGDRRYGGAARGLWPRLALHACSLAFDHPVDRRRRVVESPVPQDLAGLIPRP